MCLQARLFDLIPSRRLLENFEDLVAEVHSRSPLWDSRDHGDHHWRLVAWTGAELLEEEGRGDPLVTLLFGLFHDSQRENEYTDPEHGPRGAKLARELLPQYGVDQRTIDLVAEACELHTKASATDDPVLGLCWDSDRLNLWRVGTEPDPYYLSTSAAKKPERIKWALELQEEQPSWEEIAERYAKLSVSES